MNLKLNVDDHKIITGLDLGSTKIKCVMGLVSDQKLEIIGSAEVEHNGIQNQQMVDARATTEAIRRVCQEAEVISERQITDLWLALSSPFGMFSSQGMSIITGGQVTRRHIRQAIATAKAVPLPDHQEVVHILPSFFRVDRKDPVFNPLGLSGLRLETSVLLVTCDLSAIQDIRRCVVEAGRTSRGFVVQSVASGLAVASPEDKNTGVCVIDIGRNCSHVSVFYGGRMVHLSQVPFGGGDWTGDLVNQLKISPTMAEQVKCKYGLPLEEKGTFSIEDSSISIRCEDYHDCLIQSLETGFHQIKEKLETKGLMSQIKSGIILTGGGSLLKNIDQWARHYFEKPIRLGCADHTSSTLLSGNSGYSAALGLLYYAKEDRLDFKEPSSSSHTVNIRNWLKDLIT